MANQMEPDFSSQSSKKKEDEDLGWKKLGLFTVIVSELVGFSGAGIGIGYLAWTKLEAPVWVMILSSSAGLGIAFYRVYQISKKVL
jgi:hypothetical protein